MATAQGIWQFYIVFLQKWILSALNHLLLLHSLNRCLKINTKPFLSS